MLMIIYAKAVLQLRGNGSHTSGGLSQRANTVFTDEKGESACTTLPVP